MQLSHILSILYFSFISGVSQSAKILGSAKKKDLSNFHGHRESLHLDRVTAARNCIQQLTISTWSLCFLTIRGLWIPLLDQKYKIIIKRSYLPFGLILTKNRQEKNAGLSPSCYHKVKRSIWSIALLKKYQLWLVQGPLSCLERVSH